ncbi:putative structural protein [Escherichia coli]|uniref:Putative structural protein n=1 Tax=Escherichia coli TaxID=562 RepID=A0A2X1N041_ECOLX|nr:putative structural protein [Escherichia coli]
MYDNLKSLGITNPEEIDRYSLRQEANNDILKIYFQKDKGEFFAKSVKFKYPRQRKTVVADGVGQGYKEVQEISPNLRYIIDELIKSASVTAARLILSVRSSTTYVTWSQS